MADHNQILVRYDVQMLDVVVDDRNNFDTADYQMEFKVVNAFTIGQVVLTYDDYTQFGGGEIGLKPILIKFLKQTRRMSRYVQSQSIVMEDATELDNKLYPHDKMDLVMFRKTSKGVFRPEYCLKKVWGYGEDND